LVKASKNGKSNVVQFPKSKGGIELYKEKDDWEEESLDEKEFIPIV